MAQIVACGASALSSVALGSTAGTQRGPRIVLPIVALFVTAFVTRYMLQETQSRLQILAFVAAAALLERIRSKSIREPFNIRRWLLNAGAAAAGVLLAKHLVEPGSIGEFVTRQLHRIGIDTPTWPDSDS